MARKTSQSLRNKSKRVRRRGRNTRRRIVGGACEIDAQAITEWMKQNKMDVKNNNISIKIEDYVKNWKDKYNFFESQVGLGTCLDTAKILEKLTKYKEANGNIITEFLNDRANMRSTMEQNNNIFQP